MNTKMTLKIKIKKGSTIHVKRKHKACDKTDTARTINNTNENERINKLKMDMDINKLKLNIKSKN